MSDSLVSDPLLTTYPARRGSAPGGGVRGVALLLHGGRQYDERPVVAQNASWWRMALLARTLSHAASSQGVAVELLRYRARGWNAGQGSAPAPVVDGQWALQRLRETYGDVPVVLVGHSMGGRAVCALAGSAGVVGVVALAPWLSEADPVTMAAGQRLVLAHGSMDRWTSPRGSLQWALRARRAGAMVARYDLGPVGHFMFARTGQWNGLTRDITLGLLGLGALPTEVTAAFTATGDAGLRLSPTW